MPIQNGRYVSPTWNNNAPPAIDQTEMQAITDTLANLDAGTSGGGSGKRYASLVIGTSTNGWTTEDCDYLCDGISDNVEFQSAINALPESGGQIKVLSGIYKISTGISIPNTSEFALLLCGEGPASSLEFFTSGNSMSVPGNQTLILKDLSIVGMQGISTSPYSSIYSYGCQYIDSYFQPLVHGNVVSLYNNEFFVTKNASSSTLISLQGAIVKSACVVSGNTFLISENVTALATILRVTGSATISGNFVMVKSDSSSMGGLLGGNGCTITGNYSYGASLSTSFYGVISGNYVENSLISAQQASIGNNTVNNGYIQGSEGSSISGNTIYQESPVGSACILIKKNRNNESETAFTTISGNSCDGGAVGILLDTNSFSVQSQANAVITGNGCSSSTPLQISSNWSNCLITGNMFPNGTIIDNGSGNIKANNFTAS